MTLFFVLQDQGGRALTPGAVKRLYLAVRVCNEENTMKHLLITLTTLSFLMVLGGCSGTVDSTPVEPDEPDSAALAAMQIEGTVVYKDLEGGFFALESDDGNKFNPVNLPEDFRKDGLKVNVSARPYEGMSMHMYGTLIEIVDIVEQ
jgi:hypothetical protein